MPPSSITTVLCPLNGHEVSERALPSACHAAGLFEVGLELFSAVEDPHMVGRRLTYLDEVGAAARAAIDGEPMTKVVVDAHAPRAIADRSRDPAVLTVMATSSQPLMHSGYLGSAAERVTRDAANPVLLIGPHNQVELADVKQVVVPCDGSLLSEDILIDAVDWARRLDVELWVVTSISSKQRRAAGYRPDTEANYVRRIANQVGAEFEVLHGNDPAKTIVEWAGRSLIALTTHGRSGISRLTMGSVAVAVTRWAEGPVLVSNANKTVSGADGAATH